KEYISGEVAHVNPDGSLDVILADGRMRQEVPVAEIKFVSRSEPQSPAGFSAGEQSFWDGNEQGSEASTGQNGLKSFSSSPNHLLEQTQSFGHEISETPHSPADGEDLRDGGKPRWQTATNGSLDDILGTKLHTAEKEAAPATRDTRGEGGDDASAAAA
ncbi:unnamed protein product, partial [Ectocarpus sp. 12 AP-2014]